ncbi:hypothetical protein [Mucilaginibacter sp. SG564]|uniref:hypothetical protein n=1 Tax=Mucilaginibacter sp. SG564 TaxID=2587022 RepID=UPI0015569A58|nr:hypothetical protein [Mucilaginibacter sp. SG564]NOW98744.1 hypothetical protein [Mucilaginibacter sp. SG564]
MATSTLITGILISAIVSALFSESIVQGLGKLLSKIDLPQRADIEGLWHVEFTMSHNGELVTYREAINVVKRLGTIYGYNVPDAENHELLKLVELNEPLRIKAIIIDNRFITGTWYHPDRKSRFHGSFQLKLGLSGKSMKGVWTGYRESTNLIESGDWLWTQRNTNIS